MTLVPPCDETRRVLLLSTANLSSPVGGRAMLSRTNLLLLRDLLGDRLLQIRPARTQSRPCDAWRGYVDGVDAAFLNKLLTTIAEKNVTQLFVDGSNYGAAVTHVKRYAPRVRVITFFHNVEVRFFWGSLRVRRSAKALAVLAANYIAERAAVRRSDVLVTLSARDSAGLRRLYGRSADAVAPIVLEDKVPAGPPPISTDERYLLFVGGGFYANIAGIRWFSREVAPRLALPVRIVGRGMDEVAPELAENPHAELVGAVDDLAPWYAGATLVVAPIFDGSGMKTKVAEALMHGKHVVGTPEAFSGYASDVVAANGCGTDADSLVAAIAAAMAFPPPSWDREMRALYERDHSPATAQQRLADILRIADPAIFS